jgi:hypothetical protein
MNFAAFPVRLHSFEMGITIRTGCPRIPRLIVACAHVDVDMGGCAICATRNSTGYRANNTNWSNKNQAFHIQFTLSNGLNFDIPAGRA